MNRDVMLAGLVEQATNDGVDLLLLRAIVEEAADVGAARALASVGLTDEKAGEDVGELRALLAAWREARKSFRAAILGGLAKILIAGLITGVAVMVSLNSFFGK